jgi:hypothetical protein
MTWSEPRSTALSLVPQDLHYDGLFEEDLSDWLIKYDQRVFHLRVRL